MVKVILVTFFVKLDMSVFICFFKSYMVMLICGNKQDHPVNTVMKTVWELRHNPDKETRQGLGQTTAKRKRGRQEMQRRRQAREDAMRGNA